MLKHTSQLHLKYTQILILIAFVFSPLHLLAASVTKSEKSLDMVIGDDVAPSEIRFNYFFTCDGLNRVVEVSGRNYSSENGRGSAEITRIQTNGAIVKVSDLDSINKLINNTEGSTILSPFVKCNDHKVTFDLAYGAYVNHEFIKYYSTIEINHDGSIKIDDY